MSGARPTATPTAEELAELDAYAMAATVDFGLDAKQGLLDLRSENARLRLVTRLFRAAIKRLDFVDRAQERARSNGTRPPALSSGTLAQRWRLAGPTADQPDSPQGPWAACTANSSARASSGCLRAAVSLNATVPSSRVIL